MERLGINDSDRTSPESRQPLRPVPGEGHKGPTPETHKRWDACPGRGACLLRPLQEFHVQRAPRRLPNVGDSGDDPATSAQMGQGQGDSEGVHHTGPAGRSQDPLHFSLDTASPFGTTTSWLIPEQMPVTPPGSPRKQGEAEKLDAAAAGRMEQDVPEEAATETKHFRRDLRGS